MQNRHGLVMAALVVAGCGGPSGQAAIDMGPIGPMSPHDLDGALVALYCKNNALCGVIGVAEEAACEADAAAARQKYKPSYSPDDAVAAGRVKFDPIAAEACLDAWRAAGCTVDQSFAVGAICDKVYLPQVMPGGMCLASSECVGGYCDSLNTGCSGMCKAWLATGAACDPSNSNCDTTKDYCESTKKTCVARATTGQPCGNGVRCLLDLNCIGETMKKPGVCQPIGHVGDACINYPFGDTSCSAELFCDDSQAMPVCAARLAAGVACASLAACTDGLDCIGLSQDMTTMKITAGHCAAWLDTGVGCAPGDAEIGCPSDQTCDPKVKTCRAFGTLGDDCSGGGSGGYCRDNLYCDDGSMKCAASPGLGEACNPPMMNGTEPCRDGACDGMTKVCAPVCM